MKQGFILLIVLLSLLSLPVMALTYEDMARYPDQNKGASVTIIGEASQVIYEGDYWAVHVQTKKTSYGGYSGEDVFVIFNGLPDSGRILEDDIVQITGKYGGPYEYSTVLGAYRMIPGILGQTYLINPISGRY